MKAEIECLIRGYPNFAEFISEATRVPFINMDSMCEAKATKIAIVERMRTAVLEQDDAELGRILRELIYIQAKEWQ